MPGIPPPRETGAPDRAGRPGEGLPARARSGDGEAFRQFVEPYHTRPGAPRSTPVTSHSYDMEDSDDR